MSTSFPYVEFVVLSFFSPGRLEGCTLPTKIVNIATLELSAQIGADGKFEIADWAA